MDQSGSCIFRRLIPRQVAGDAPGGVGTSEMASSSRADVDGDDASVGSEEYVRDDGSLLSLQPWIFKKGNFKADRERTESTGSDLAGALLSPRRKGSCYGFVGGRSRPSRLKERYFVEPLSPIESCLVPQLCNENFGMDEYVFSSLPSSPSSNFRPLLITDGNRLISRSSCDSLTMLAGDGLNYNANRVGSVPPSATLPHAEANGGVGGALVGLRPLPESRKSKSKIREPQHGRLNASDQQKSGQEGSFDKLHLFTLGICIGVWFTNISNRVEVGKLTKLLKDNQDLVQDLQEELEMKDSLITKELTDETERYQEASHSLSNSKEYIEYSPNRSPASHYCPQETEESERQHLPRPQGNPDLLDKIEAELEAELERLEQNINASVLQGGRSDLSELDPDLVGDIVQGELRADLLEQGAPGQLVGNSDSNSTSTAHTHNANYSVSPKELSLRLHEVIRIRQEERIKELEAALAENRVQLKSMETERASSQRAFTNSEMGSSSNQGSPVVMQSHSGWSNPLCLNLGGDALDAYGEAYEEFTRMSEENNPPSSLNTSGWRKSYTQNQSAECRKVEDTGTDKSLTSSQIFEIETRWDEIMWSRESSDAVEEGVQYSEGDFTDDEEEKKLIQKILEKTRQGSPGLMYAQRMLSLVDEKSFNVIER